MRLGNWTLLGPASPSSDRHRRVRCRCKCGVIKVVGFKNMVRGQSSECKSCAGRKKNVSHGSARVGKSTPEYRSWCNMITRCTNRNRKGWKNYGGRGITVCARWRRSFPAFLADVGLRPSPKHSIDRANNDGNYKPDNVRWATAKEQANNRRPRRRNA